MPPSTPTPPNSAVPTRTILVVDDFTSVRFYHANLLRQAGFKTIEARDGGEALEKVGQSRVDLILLDLVMPRMSGEEFIRRIRSAPEYASIPLLVVTSEPVEEKILQFADIRRIGFAMKPLVPTALLESVRKLIA